MKNEAKRKRALDRIRENIARSGHHVYVVLGGSTPRFAYTIGVGESLGVELILAGAVFYMKNEVLKIVNEIAGQLKAQRDRDVFEVTGQGLFTLRKADASWTEALMLGAFDYYQKRDIPGLQIVPDQAYRTVDVPDMSAPWSATTAPAWRWLHESWTYPVPRDSTAATNLAALRGDRITEVMRWEEDVWEIFAGAGPDVTDEEGRVVPLGTLLGTDESLVAGVHLAIGKDFGAMLSQGPSGIHGTSAKMQRKAEEAARGRVFVRVSKRANQHVGVNMPEASQRAGFIRSCRRAEKQLFRDAPTLQPGIAPMPAIRLWRADSRRRGSAQVSRAHLDAPDAGAGRMSSIGNGIWYGHRTTASVVVVRMLAQSRGTSRLVRREGGRLGENLKAPTLQKHFCAVNAPYALLNPCNTLKSKQMRPPSERTRTRVLPCPPRGGRRGRE